MPADPRFAFDTRFQATEEDEQAVASGSGSGNGDSELEDGLSQEGNEEDEDEREGEGGEGGEGEEEEGDEDATDDENYNGEDAKVVKPLTPEALKAFNAAQARTGVVYISRIPPGMRPTKVRHLMSQHGNIGRVYLQQEDAKRAYLRRKHTSTKKAHFTEGWVEFADKKVARAVAGLLNAQPIGGKKGTRWRDDVWTMKYLPRFKWDMLTEQIAHEAAQRSAQLRVELAQSRTDQRDYLKNVELARVLTKRAKRKEESEQKVDASDSKAFQPSLQEKPVLKKRIREGGDDGKTMKKTRIAPAPSTSRLDDRTTLDSVLSSIF